MPITEPDLPKLIEEPDARATVPPHLPIVTEDPQTTIGLEAPDPTVVVVPHRLIIFVPH